MRIPWVIQESARQNKSLGVFGKVEQNDWRQVSLAVESGARVTVVGPREIPNYPAVETPASKAGEESVAA